MTLPLLLCSVARAVTMKKLALLLIVLLAINHGDCGIWGSTEKQAPAASEASTPATPKEDTVAAKKPLTASKRNRKNKAQQAEDRKKTAATKAEEDLKRAATKAEEDLKAAEEKRKRVAAARAEKKKVKAAEKAEREKLLSAEKAESEKLLEQQRVKAKKDQRKWCEDKLKPLFGNTNSKWMKVSRDEIMEQVFPSLLEPAVPHDWPERRKKEWNLFDSPQGGPQMTTDFNTVIRNFESYKTVAKGIAKPKKGDKNTFNCGNRITTEDNVLEKGGSANAIAVKLPDSGPWAEGRFTLKQKIAVVSKRISELDKDNKCLPSTSMGEHGFSLNEKVNDHELKCHVKFT